MKRQWQRCCWQAHSDGLRRKRKTMTNARRNRILPGMRKPKREYIGILYCLPYVVVFLFGMIIPMFYALYLSFFKQSLLGGTTFAGFDNFIAAFKDEALWSGFRRVLIYAAIQIPLNLILSLAAALILDSQRIRHIAVPRILLFLPYAVPGVIAALMWGYIYGDKYGLVGQIASMIGATAPNMLSEKLMLFAIANICTWCSLGYNMLIYYSALIGIPNELYESARIDGASELRIAWSVKIPQIKGSIMMTVLFSVIGTLQLFNEPSILMNSAPNVITSNYTPNLYAYNLAFNGQNLNYAAAVSLVIGVIVMGLVAVVKVIGNKWENK
ncbi:carbohydrate ABC transporter permease [Bifidobacterium catenulatum]|uniref:carbohydrate ABC transporter permease n=1 Tax=Bifidobacterium catenulatum TaxID=1686 RepID=UPI00247FF341|nr:sugar ABC transporter permease [Bifidobacterium catenulatum]MDH7874209.1 sugar ABC transporter permease [Bifidobacterium catenulatum subsp. kashiwanohense]